MTFDAHAQIARFAAAFQSWNDAPVSIAETLRDLLHVTDSRAVGLWRVAGDKLQLLGFAAKPDMPQDVQQGFAAATREVPLSQTGLGIVKAAVNRGPAVAYIEAGQTGLADSASWLAKFEAVQSLAVPIFRGEDVGGVLAMSTANPFVENDDVWQLITGIARRLSNR